MNILIVNYEYPPVGGGGGVASQQLAEGFLQNGHSVHVLTTWFRGLPKEELVNGVHVHRVRVLGRTSLPTATMSSLLTFPPAAYRKGLLLCKKYNIDIINSHFVVPSGVLGDYLAGKFSLPHILSIHGGDIYDPTKSSSPHRYSLLRKLIQRIMNRSSVIVSNSTNIKDYAIQYYSPKNPIHVIPLPYAFVSFKKSTRKALNLEKNTVYLVSVGRMVARKGYEYLLRTLAKTPINIHLLLIGDGPLKNSLELLAKNLGIESRVTFLGFVSKEKKFQYLAASDVYVLSSVHEGFGIVLQEAMQVGLPIIATDNGGQRDFVFDNKNGYLVHYGDEQALLKNIITLSKNRSLQKKFRKANLTTVKSFAPTIIAKKHLELIQ